MQLLEFYFWTDVVVCGIIVTAVCSVIIIVLLVRLLNKSEGSDDDPTGEIKQRIYNTLLKVRDNIEKTV